MSIESAYRFADIINRYSYTANIDSDPAPHINVTFFLGAGFSKSWDDRYPLASELFIFKAEHVYSSFREIADIFWDSGIDTLSDITPDKLKEIVYHLNMELKYPAIRSRYRDENGIRIALDMFRANIIKNFLGFVSPDYVTSESTLIHLPDEISEGKKKILRFFDDVAYHEDGSRGYPAGVRINFITTNYDFIIETIIDAISHSDDEPNYLNTYRGITPTKICGSNNPSTIHSHIMARTLIKLNGGLEILRNTDGTFNFEYRERGFDEIYKNPSVIMMPSKEQDYQDSYFNSIFPKAVRLLNESKVLVIIGYSFPEDDAMLRFLLRQFAEDNRDAKDKSIFYVDRMAESKQDNRLKDCFPYLIKSRKSNVYLYSGDFADWAEAATNELQQNVDKAAYEKVLKDFK